MGGVLGKLLEQIFYLLFEDWKILCCGFPDDVVIHGKVPVDEAIPHVDNLPPRNRRILLLVCICYLRHRLTDDFKFANHRCCHHGIISKKGLLLYADYVTFDAADGVQDMIRR